MKSDIENIGFLVKRVQERLKSSHPRDLKDAALTLEYMSESVAILRKKLDDEIERLTL